MSFVDAYRNSEYNTHKCIHHPNRNYEHLFTIVPKKVIFTNFFVTLRDNAKKNK